MKYIYVCSAGAFSKNLIKFSRASGRCQREEDRVIPKPWKAEMSLGPASAPPGSQPPLVDTMGYHSCPDIPSVPPQYPPTIQPPISGASSLHIITPFKMPHINSAEFHHLPSFEHRSCMIIKDTWSIAIIIDFVPGPKDRRMLSRLSSKGESGDERLMRGWLDVNQGFFSDQTMLAISLTYPSLQYHNTTVLATITSTNHQRNVQRTLHHHHLVSFTDPLAFESGSVLRRPWERPIQLWSRFSRRKCIVTPRLGTPLECDTQK